MRTTFVFFACIFFLTLGGCSHKYDIKRSHVYSRKITAGNIPVDENNRPLTNGVQKAHLVYLETADTLNKLIWDTAWINNTAYSVQPIRLAQDKINLGKLKNEEKEVILQAEPGNIMWQLLLKPLPQIKPPDDLSEQLNKYPVVLTGYQKGKKVLYKIKEEKELNTIYGE